MIFNIEKNVVFILFIIHFVVSVIFLFLRGSQEEKVTEEKDLGEEEQITKKNIQTQLYIHSGISAAVCAAAIVYCAWKEFRFFNLYKHGPMILHLVASVVVLLFNGNPDTSLWLSWVFQIVSILVTGAQCLTRIFFSNNWVKNVKMVTNPIGTKETKAALQQGIDKAKVAEAAGTQVVQQAQEAAKQVAAKTQEVQQATKFGKFLNFGKRKLK